jgi:hypothetical protein
MSTTTNNQDGNSVAAVIDNSDFLMKFPELAQKFAAMNQVVLTGEENELLKKTMAAQVVFIMDSLMAGFSSAAQTMVYGGVLAAMGGVQALGNVAGIYSTGKNIADMSALQDKTDTELAEFNAQNGATNHATIEGDDGNPVEEDDIPLRDIGTTTRIQKLGDGLDEQKPVPSKTKEEILNKQKTEIAKLEQEQQARKLTSDILNNLSSTGQLVAQNAQANTQMYQVTQQAYNNNYTTLQTAAGSVDNTLRHIMQFDPYSQNIGSTGKA